jgi:hypothetical protein
MKAPSKKKIAEYFEFLDNLRESGVTNMYAARPYLQEAFGLPPDKATKILSSWMKTFDREKPPLSRAEAAVLLLQQ